MECKHSYVLFIDPSGDRMEFYVKSCPESETLKKLIEHGGGLFFESPGKGLIRLVDPTCKVLNVKESEKVVSMKYIYDCVEKNLTLDLEPYLVKVESEDISDLDDISEKSSEPHVPFSAAPKGGQMYSSTEDEILLNFLLSNSQLYLEMPLQSFCNHMFKKHLLERTGRSLDNRLRHLTANPNSFNLGKEKNAEIKRLFQEKKKQLNSKAKPKHSYRTTAASSISSSNDFIENKSFLNSTRKKKPELKKKIVRKHLFTDDKLSQRLETLNATPKINPNNASRVHTEQSGQDRINNLPSSNNSSPEKVSSSEESDKEMSDSELDTTLELESVVDPTQDGNAKPSQGLKNFNTQDLINGEMITSTPLSFLEEPPKEHSVCKLDSFDVSMLKQLRKCTIMLKDFKQSTPPFNCVNETLMEEDQEEDAGNNSYDDKEIPTNIEMTEISQEEFEQIKANEIKNFEEDLDDVPESLGGIINVTMIEEHSDLESVSESETLIPESLPKNSSDVLAKPLRKCTVRLKDVTQSTLPFNCVKETLMAKDQEDDDEIENFEEDEDDVPESVGAIVMEEHSDPEPISESETSIPENLPMNVCHDIGDGQESSGEVTVPMDEDCFDPVNRPVQEKGCTCGYLVQHRKMNDRITNFFNDATKIVQKLDEAICTIDVHLEAKVKDHLQQNLSKLKLKLYGELLTQQVQTILRKPILSIKDKYLLLKYLSHVSKKSLQDILHDLGY